MPPEAPKMVVKPAAETPTITRDDPGQANHAREGPPQNLTPHGRAAPPAEACPSGALARVTLGYWTSAAAARECGSAFTALQPVLWSKDTTL